MATVFNNIDTVSGAPQSVSVTIDIVWDTDESPVAYDLDDEKVIRGPWKTDTDSDGSWSINLVANSEISPDSAYEITEKLSDDSEITYYIRVNNSATPSYWVVDLIIDKPDWI